MTAINSQRKILLVEDDASLGQTLQERLSRDFLVTWSQTQKEALQALEEQIFHLVILDVGLPDGSGFQIAEKMGQMQNHSPSYSASHLASYTASYSPSRTPLIFLTAQGDAESRLQGYELGALEYIPKPFHLKELLIRIEHVMKSVPASESLKLPTCEIFFDEMRLQKITGEIEYPALRDLQVLKLLVKKAPEPVSRDQILDEVWGPDKEINHRTIDNTIVRLKKLLGDDNDQLIRSVRGVGYHWIYVQQKNKSNLKT